MLLIFKVFIAIFALAGYLLASYIRSTKRTNATLTCPLEGSCENVIYSRYSRLFGIPVEILGMLYYGIVFIFYSMSAILRYSVPVNLSLALIALSIIAFLFSLYLTAVQAFLIQHWCTWCLCSAGLCTLIFLLALLIMNEGGSLASLVTADPFFIR